jgi:hypothetical protein
MEGERVYIWSVVIKVGDLINCHRVYSKITKRNLFFMRMREKINKDDKTKKEKVQIAKIWSI